MEDDEKVRCDSCHGALDSGETGYRMDGKLMCADCFRAWFLDLLAVSPAILARLVGAQAEIT